MSAVILVSARSKDVKIKISAVFAKNKVLFQDFIRLSMPAVANDVIWGVAFSVYAAILGNLSDDVVAANAIVAVVRNFGTVFCFGIASAGGILIGKIIGENKPEEAREGARKMVKLTVISGIIGGLIVLAAMPLVLELASYKLTDDALECHIVLSRTKLNSVSVEAEGTYSAGDWGIAVGAGYANRNLFRGAEEFTLDGRASYEWRQNGGRAIEGKASMGLKFPNSLAVDLNYNYQNRPDEYTRSIFNAGLQYQLRQQQLHLQHQFRIVDISYVYLPWISDAFRDQFLQSTNILKYSYENHFIVGWGYSGNYSSFNARRPYRSYSNVNYNVETAGNLMLGLAEAFHFPTDEDGKYTLFNTRFAQFAKADVAFTYNQIFNERHRLVYHADLGVAVPYGNSLAVPFEKRYFAGGSNSVRGWTARSLGPGGYRGSGSLIDFNNQSGDIRMNLNLEYRAKVWSIFELAAFVDAGNIWTIFDYETQPHGQFHWNEFYKQIALAYGVGVRLDFSIFVFRVDFGVKLYDPSRLYGGEVGTQWRTVPNGLNWAEDMSFHFAIGYPF